VSGIWIPYPASGLTGYRKRAFRERQERYLKDVTELPLRAPRARSISESDKSEYNYTPMGTQDSEDLDGSLFESWSVLSPTPREDLDDLLFENMTSLNLTPREDLDGYVVGNLTSLNPTLREAQTVCSIYYVPKSLVLVRALMLIIYVCRTTPTSLLVSPHRWRT
jgi:hypothetical protein